MRAAASHPRRSTSAWLWLAVLIWLPTAAVGQTTDPINASLEFNFNNPGARSLGLGGAFTAKADDATAVYANPAGLVQLSLPEVSIESRNWEFSSPYLDSGTQVRAGDTTGLVFDHWQASTRGLSFASALRPARNGRWVFGVFWHQAANYRAEVHSQGARLVPGAGGQDLTVRPVDGTYDLDIGSLGFSSARRLTKRLSLGVTATYSSFSLASRVERWNHLRDEPRPEENPGATVVEGDPEACCRFTERADVAVYFTQVEDPDADSDLTATLGLLWQSKSKVRGAHLVTLGAVARRGAEFGFRGNAFRASTIRVPGTNEFVRTFESQIDDPQDPIECRDPSRPGCPGRFRVPDVLGMGVSVRPGMSWLLALDINRVHYSGLADHILDIDGADSGLGGQGNSGRPTDFRVEDATEIRFGVEYGIYRERALPDLFVRAGAWSDPSHDLRYVGEDDRLQALWASGTDTWHAALGFGLRLRRFQLDAAVDSADNNTTASLSSVYYFGR